MNDTIQEWNSFILQFLNRHGYIFILGFSILPNKSHSVMDGCDSLEDIYGWVWLFVAHLWVGVTI